MSLNIAQMISDKRDGENLLRGVLCGYGPRGRGCGRRWAWLADGGVRAAAGARRARLRLASDHLQHDELTRAELVRQRHDRLLVVADEHAEHVHAGVDCRHRGPVRHAPHADRVVARPGHGQLVVVRQRAAPDLHIHADHRSRQPRCNSSWTQRRIHKAWLEARGVVQRG